MYNIWMFKKKVVSLFALRAILIRVGEKEFGECGLHGLNGKKLVIIIQTINYYL